MPHGVDIPLVPRRPRQIKHELPAPGEQHNVHEAVPLVFDELEKAQLLLLGEDLALELHHRQRDRAKQQNDQDVSRHQQRRGATGEVHLQN